MKHKVETAIGFFVVISLFWMMGVRQYFTGTRPQQPHAESAHLIPTELNYGKIAYLSKKEQWLLMETYVQFGIAVALVMVIMIKRPDS
ncbi:MAG TPA: hypothetical protein VIT91_06690 [Chthoniobacterales bacterium]